MHTQTYEHNLKHNLYCNVGNPWLLQHDDTALFWHVISYHSQLCIQKLMPKELAKCYQTLPSQVESGGMRLKCNSTLIG